MITKKINKNTIHVAADEGKMLTFQTAEQLNFDPRKYSAFNDGYVVESQVNDLREITIKEHLAYLEAKKAADEQGENFKPHCATCKNAQTVKIDENGNEKTL